MTELQFNEERHEYSVDGNIIPSVTQIISDMGLSGIPYEILQELKALKNEEIEVCHLSGKALAIYQAGQFGTAVHKATELHDRGTLNIKTVDDAIRPYLEAWYKFKKETGVAFIEIELRLHNPLLGYAGTIDRVSVINGKRFIVEIKTSAKFPATIGLQTAAYQELYNCNRKILSDPIKNRIGVLLKPDATFKSDDSLIKKTDLNNFQSALSLYKWKKNMFKS